MASESITELEKILAAVAGDLPKVSSRKMFGCHALWVGGNVFALVWKHGRIGLKLPDEASYVGLMRIAGAEPWKAGPMKMAHWVLVPETFHSKKSELKKWALRAHEQCSVLEPKVKKPSASKKKASKKGASRK